MRGIFVIYFYYNSFTGYWTEGLTALKDDPLAELLFTVSHHCLSY